MKQEKKEIMKLSPDLSFSSYVVFTGKLQLVFFDVLKWDSRKIIEIGKKDKWCII